MLQLLFVHCVFYIIFALSIRFDQISLKLYDTFCTPNVFRQISISITNVYTRYDTFRQADICLERGLIARSTRDAFEIAESSKTIDFSQFRDTSQKTLVDNIDTMCPANRRINEVFCRHATLSCKMPFCFIQNSLIGTKKLVIPG